MPSPETTEADVELMAKAHDALRALCRSPRRKQTIKMWCDAWEVADKLAKRVGKEIEP